MLRLQKTAPAFVGRGFRGRQRAKKSVTIRYECALMILKGSDIYSYAPVLWFDPEGVVLTAIDHYKYITPSEYKHSAVFYFVSLTRICWMY